MNSHVAVTSRQNENNTRSNRVIIENHFKLHVWYHIFLAYDVSVTALGTYTLNKYMGIITAVGFNMLYKDTHSVMPCLNSDKLNQWHHPVSIATYGNHVIKLIQISDVS